MGVNVYLWGKHVGALVQTEEGTAFEYTAQFKRSSLEISPIFLPLSGKKVYINEPEWKATMGIPGVIYDCLPDRFGNDLLKIYFASKGLTETDIDIFAKLQYIGSRGMGALEFQPSENINTVESVLSLEEIEKLAALGTANKKSLKTNIKSSQALRHILHIGTSAGGARAKALIAIHKKSGELRSGQLPLGPDYEYFIIKIDGANKTELNEPSGFGKLEYSYAQMAKECGIQMTECKLYNGTHFLTKRFDRDDRGNKLHVHSLCGLMGLDYTLIGQYSYEQFFMAARKLGLHQDTQEEIFRRMVFNVLAHNCDDHSKNFAFLMDSSGSWSLSPAYDLCYSYDSSNAWVNGHNMTVNGKRNGITKKDIMMVGQKFNIKKSQKIFAHIQTVLDDFPNFAKRNKVKPTLIKEVEKNRPRL